MQSKGCWRAQYGAHGSPPTIGVEVKFEFTCLRMDLWLTLGTEVMPCSSEGLRLGVCLCVLDRVCTVMEIVCVTAVLEWCLFHSYLKLALLFLSSTTPGSLYLLQYFSVTFSVSLCPITPVYHSRVSFQVLFFYLLLIYSLAPLWPQLNNLQIWAAELGLWSVPSWPHLSILLHWIVM